MKLTTTNPERGQVGCDHEFREAFLAAEVTRRRRANIVRAWGALV
jgi:hypothetical protein